MNGVKVQKMPEIRRDADKYSKTVEGFYDLLMNYLKDESYKEQYDLRMVVNFTSDATSMPNCTGAAMKVLNKKDPKKKIEGILTDF